MKINHQFSHLYTSRREAQKPVTPAASETKGCQFDQLILSHKQAVTEPEQELKARVIQDIDADAPRAKLASLKSAVAAGTYQVDLQEIAKKMLLFS